MSGSSLADLLARLAKETPAFENGARLLDASDPLAAILAEIDMTVLPARLTFTTDADTLELVVTGRRLHQILSGAPKQVIGLPLNPEDAELTLAAAQSLADFANGAARLHVSVGLPPDAGSDLSDSVSTGVILSALGLSDDDPDAPLHERFLTRLGDVGNASIVLTDRVAGDMRGAGAEIFEDFGYY